MEEESAIYELYYETSSYYLQSPCNLFFAELCRRTKNSRIWMYRTRNLGNGNYITKVSIVTSVLSVPLSSVLEERLHNRPCQRMRETSVRTH